MEPELSDRQRIILRYIVQEYVRSGRAVGSKTLIERYSLSVSSATVRNEMGELEDREFLQHPHTSAGRVPTDRGYRYYIEHLLDDTNLPPSEQLRIRHQFQQVQNRPNSSARLAASILADLSGNLGLVTPPRSATERLRHFELIHLRDQVTLLIAVSESGRVYQSVLPLPEAGSQDELSALSRRLNLEVRGLTAVPILKKSEELDGIAQLVLRSIAETLQQDELENQNNYFAEGLERALQQPEFDHSIVAQRLLELLRGGAILSSLLPQLEFDDDVQVFIGSENKSENLRPFGVVVSTYGTGDEISGLVGVLGPTRMPYGRAISTVRYLSRVLSDLFSSIYEHDDETDD